MNNDCFTKTLNSLFSTDHKTHAQIVNPTNDPLRDILVDPKKFLTSRGYDPEKLRFEFFVDKTSRTKPSIEMRAYYQDENVVSMSFLDGSGEYLSEERSTLSGSSISKNGKKTDGLGSITYLTAARKLFKEYGVRMASDMVDMGPSYTLSADAKKVWGRFHQMGLAKVRCPHYGSCYFYFTEEALKGADLSAFDIF